MNDLRAAWDDFRQAWRPLVLFQVALKFVEAWLLVPALALLLAALLARAGHVAVSNLDVVDFLLTPTGLLYAGLLATGTVAVLFFELAGVMVVADRVVAGERLSVAGLVRAALGKVPRIVRLGAATVALLALVLAPFVLLIYLTYSSLLTGHDIYFYVKERPPVFWLAVGIAGLLVVAAVAVVAWLYVRWAFALPVLLFEKATPSAALRASRDRVRGSAWRVGFVLIGWIVSVLLLGALAGAGFRLVASAVLDRAGERPVATILLLLTGQAMLLAAVSFVLVVGLGLLTRRLYLRRSEQLGVAVTEEPAADPREAATGRLTWMVLPLLLLVPLGLWAGLAAYLTERPPVGVTAHRGHARAAPENTLAAIRKAIDSGADYVEIDVHQTKDGAIVLLHDRDLKRVAGLSRRLDELSLDEVRALDVGAWFGPAFAGERVPTLQEAIRLCRGRIRMNIELKIFGSDRRLAVDVARLVGEEGFEAECVVTSFEYDALREAKEVNPALRRGLIVAHAIGDVSRIDVEVLSVRADFLSDDLVRSAHRAGREVHVWTVNDPRQMARLIQRGADNLITSDPDLAIRVRDEWAALSEAERLLLTSRLLLGLDP